MIPVLHINHLKYILINCFLESGNVAAVTVDVKDEQALKHRVSLQHKNVQLGGADGACLLQSVSAQSINMFWASGDKILCLLHFHEDELTSIKAMDR